MAEGIKKSQTRPRFNGKISAEFTPPKTWELEKGLSFITLDLTEAEIQTLQDVGANIAETGRITCKKGMKTDLASVPRIVWNILAPWDVARAAVIHDHLYASLRTYYHSDDFDKLNTVVLGISKDPIKKQIKFREKNFLHSICN